MEKNIPPDCDRAKNICRREPYCKICQEEVDRYKADKSPVSRNGSSYCKSNAIAAGGWRTYCTCDTCF